MAPIQGAVAYAWFVGPAGSETLQAITTLNSADLRRPAGQRAAAGEHGDGRLLHQRGAFDGLLTTALKSGSNAYVKTLAGGRPRRRLNLTGSGQGSVVEIDDMLQAMWESAQVSPTVLYVNSRQARDISAKCLTSASGPLLHYFQQPDGGGQVSAGGMIEFYYNPFLLDGGVKIPIKIHPYVPPGTILGWCEDLPAQYQNSDVPNVAEVKCRQDYYAIDWPITTRQRQKGVYCEEVLAVYAPFAMGVITNIAAG